MSPPPPRFFFFLEIVWVPLLFRGFLPFCCFRPPLVLDSRGPAGAILNASRAFFFLDLVDLFCSTLYLCVIAAALARVFPNLRNISLLRAPRYRISAQVLEQRKSTSNVSLRSETRPVQTRGPPLAGATPGQAA